LQTSSHAAEVDPKYQLSFEAGSRGVEPSYPVIALLPPISERRTAIKVEKYDGSTCIETFLLKFDHIARYNNWRDSDRAAHLAAALTGSAGLILWNLPEPTYGELVDRLRQRYGSTEQREKVSHELRARRRSRNEGLQELAQDIERLAALAYPDDPQATRDRLGVESFIEALNDSELMCKIREREPASLQSALSTAMKLEILHRARDTAIGRSVRPILAAVKSCRASKALNERSVERRCDRTNNIRPRNEVNVRLWRVQSSQRLKLLRADCVSNWMMSYMRSRQLRPNCVG
jgi:hypothetical protein